MKRSFLNLVVDFGVWLSFSTMVATGLLLEFVLPKRSGRDGLSLLGYRRHDWAEVHAWLSVGFIVLLLLHLLLHWEWIVSMCWGTAQRPQSWARRAGVMSALLVSILLMVSPLLLQ